MEPWLDAIEATSNDNCSAGFYYPPIKQHFLNGGVTNTHGAFRVRLKTTEKKKEGGDIFYPDLLFDPSYSLAGIDEGGVLQSRSGSKLPVLRGLGTPQVIES